MAAGQGLMGLLQRRAQPAIRCFSQPVAEADEDAKILLVDGGAVLQAILESFPQGDEQAAQKSYLHTCRFVTGLKRTGLRVWIVLGGELAGDLEQGAKDPTDPSNVAHLAFHQALLDLNVTVHWAPASQHPLILDLYRKNRTKVEAVMSSDVCYFVYGVTTCSFVKDVLVDRQSTTLVLWDCQECWKKWRLAVGGRFGDLGPLERAQVAALLGVSVPKGAVTLEDGVAGLSMDSKKTMELLTSPSVAATMALAFDASEELPMKFFQEVLGLNRFAEKDLKAFRRAVAELMMLVSRVKSSSGSDAVMDGLPAVPADLRARLLPDTPVPTTEDLLAPDEGSILAIEEAEGKSVSDVLVEVGSSLKQSEWNEIDDKDIISKTRYGAGFKIMQKIPAFTTESELPTVPSARIDIECVWQYLYASRKEDKAFKRVVEAAFPQRWEAARDKDSKDKKTSSELKKLTQSSVMEKVSALRDAALAKRTKEWLQYLPGKDVESMLALRREAIIQGADSVAWKAAEACWGYANARLKSSVLNFMFTCDNKAAVAGPPGRYPHQEELLRMIHEHLSREGSGEIDHSLPLQIELSTPTGSGKTFAALMVHLQLLKVHHPDAILVYSVPTKSVLKTVGQACEAHSVVYWTAATEGSTRYQVRRPYSIRTTKTKGDAGSSGMAEQLEANRKEGKEKRDRGNGKPDVIIADIQATAALARSSSEENPMSPFHAANIVLYFDEPNMGVHLNAKVRETVSKILEYSPFTTVLASATLPPWSLLQPWWRCGGKPATRATITLEPYDLPQANLEVLDELRQELRTTNLLSLFDSHKEFCEVLRDNKRLQIVLLRHLTPQQGMDLLGADTDTEHVGFGLLHGEVSTLREALEANLSSLMDDRERYEDLRSKWNKADTNKSIDARNGPAVGGVISKTGITMIATQEARKLALELAGKHDDRLWSEKMHKLNADRAQATKLHKEAEKERARRKNDDGPNDGAITGYIRLREGIQVSLSDADGADQDELLMLQAGIAYSTAGGASPLVQRLYQQTLLSVPEKVMAQSRKLPPINVLVVDYSSIYGTDCPAVDTLVMMNDLGKALSWQDSQQFMGRLRRDGRAIFCNFDTLRRASTSIGEVQDSAPDSGTSRDVSMMLLQAAAKGTPAPQILPKLDEKRREGGVTKSAMGCNAAVAMFAQLLGAPPGARGAEKKAYKSAPITAATAPAAMKAAVDKWGPLVRHLARTDEDQVQVLCSLQALAEGKGEWGEAGTFFMDLTPRLLKLLYDEDVISEEAVFAWEAATRKTAGDSRFLKLAGPLITWLKEAEEDSDEDEDDE